MRKIIPIQINKFTFNRVKAPKIDDRKVLSINSIQGTLRSSIYRQLSRRLNVNLFIRIWLVLVCSGCMVGPNYKPPELCISDDWNADENLSVESPKHEWWTVFQDDLLTKYISLASLHNFDLQAAESNIVRARAIRQVSQSNLFPQVNLDTNGTKTYFSKNGPVFAIGQASGNPADTSSAATGLPFAVQAPQTQNLFNFLFDASWELDLFGKNRRLVEAANAEYEGMIEQKNDLLISIFAELAKNYIDLRTFQEKAELLERKVSLFEQLAKIVEARFEAGYSNRLDLERSQADLYSVKSELPLVYSGIYSSIYSLSILIGHPPETLVDELLEKRSLPDAPEEIAVGMRSDLLRRRPDVRYAERKLAEATAEVGIAVASFFPTVTLAANGGLQSLSLPNLFEWGSRTWAYGADVNMPIFQGGRLIGTLHVTQAEQAMRAANYQQTVLSALANAESSLKQFVEQTSSLNLFEKTLNAVENEEKLSKERYLKGLINLTDYIHSENQLVDSLLNQLDKKNQQILSLISLYKALGGGWEVAF